MRASITDTVSDPAGAPIANALVTVTNTETNSGVTTRSRYRGWAVQYPNAAQVQPGSAALENPTSAKYFNTSLWVDPSTGKYVPAQPAYTLRNFPTLFSNVRVPGYNNLDALVSKFFPITERVRLQFRSQW